MLKVVTNTDIGMLDSGAWCTPLTGFEFTLCHGNDSARFLQGQLSCNIQKLTPAISLRGALCNLKGRVITDVRVMSDDNGILLLTQHGMSAKMITTLDKYRVFFKTVLEPVKGTLLVTGLGGPKCSSAAKSIGLSLPEGPDQVVENSGLRIIALSPSQLCKYPRYLCLARTENVTAQKLMQVITEKFERIPESSWRVADIRTGEAHIRPDQSELFTPQLLNYDINGIIDFKKGCYTGQEIVARMHYKAEAKRRLYHVKAASYTAHESAIDGHDVDIVDMVLLADGSVESLMVINERSLLAMASQASLTSFSPVHFP